jgi:glycosyltransferase involved in cell wall biosynthesis
MGKYTTSSVVTLQDLPQAPAGKTGWPWTESCPPSPACMPDGSEWPRISIVTPSYNQGAFIEETIRSVLLQGYPFLEYLVIDGNSSDETLDILHKYQRFFSYWVSENDRGPSDAIDKGWQRTHGEIIAYLNSDDVYLPGTLTRVAQSFHEYPETSLLCGNELAIDTEGAVLGTSEVKEINYLRLLNLTFIPQPAVFVKKQSVEHVGGIDPKVKYTFDFELWLRIARSFQLHSVSEFFAMTRWHEQTITLNQRVNIAREISEIVTCEIRREDGGLTKQERRQALCKVHRFAMKVHLESRAFFRGAVSAIQSLRFARDRHTMLKIVKKYVQYLFVKKSQLPYNAISHDAGNIHWSEFLS